MRAWTIWCLPGCWLATYRKPQSPQAQRCVEAFRGMAFLWANSGSREARHERQAEGQHMNLKVLDLSHHNTVTSFRAIKAAGVVGVIHKASQGLGMVDNAYNERRVQARSAGLLWGAYHFNTGDDPAAQVEHFLKAADPDDRTVMALDWEANKGHDMSARKAHDFLAILGQRLGRKPIIYSGNVAKEQLGPHPDLFFGAHRLWLCQYGRTPRWHPSWSDYWLWQYTDGTAPHPLPEPHKVSGVSGLLDCNHYDGTDEQLSREWAS